MVEELKPENRPLFTKIAKTERYLAWLMLVVALLFLSHITALIITTIK
jgi:hypothetical protein